MSEKPIWSETNENHPMSKMLRSIIDGHRTLCAEAGISPWDFCVMMANAQGIILALSKDMPTKVVLERIQKLSEVSNLRALEERAPPISDSKN